MTLKSNIYSLFLFSLLFLFSVNPAAAATNLPHNHQIVYGFYPDYPYRENYQPDWTSLTHIAWYKWILNEDGTLQPTDNISCFNDVKAQAHAHGVKVCLCIKGYNSVNQNPMDNVLAYHQQDCIQNITDLLNSTGADGVNLDWEAPSSVTNSVDGKLIKPEFENFMKNLYTTIKTLNSSYHLSFDTYSELSNEELFQNANLSNYCDNIFLMDYDMGHWKTGPNSPCNGSSYYDVGDSIDDWEIYYPGSKIIMGLPFYGYDMPCSGSSPRSTVYAKNAVYIGDAETYSQTNTSFWDLDSQTPWYRYQVGDQWHQVWYDNETSLAIKSKYAKDHGIAGVGFWALGYEHNYMNVWNVFKPNINGEDDSNEANNTTAEKDRNEINNIKSSRFFTFWSSNFFSRLCKIIFDTFSSYFQS